MIQHIWTVACRFSTVDRESNNVSLISILEEITIPLVLPSKPDHHLIPALFDVVTLWGRENDIHPVTGEGRMSIVSSEDHPLLVHQYDIDLQRDRRFRSVGRILGFPTQKAGRYHFRVESRHGGSPWEVVAKIPIWVNLANSEGVALPQRNRA